METLYAPAANGKRKQWSVTVVEDEGGAATLEATHGYAGGVLTTSGRCIATGKNAGKRNATTAVQQAWKEAESMWKKKRDAGYEPATATATPEAVATATAVALPLPMLAQPYSSAARRLVFPCYAQRKLDGVRCLAVSGRGLYSRNRKPFSNLAHIQTAVDALVPPGTVLDGELYSETHRFQELVGLVMAKRAQCDTSAVFLWVYDVVLPEQPYSRRHAYLCSTFAGMDLYELPKDPKPALRLLDTSMVSTAEGLHLAHAQFVEEGYEGIILRNSAGKYRTGVRSADLQKHKDFHDGEFRVVGFTEGEGGETGCVLWICETEESRSFTVRPRGSREERAAAFANAGAYVGRMLTVRYQELTDRGIPRFPVGIAFREYE